jgi:hypothetical protein
MFTAPTRTPAQAAASAAPTLKAFYVALYCAGCLSESVLVELFRRHPEWRAA